MADSLAGIIHELGQLEFDEIAAKLEGLGIRGNKSSASTCPLAIFLTKQIDSSVFVGSDIAVSGRVMCTLPESVYKFVIKFDNGGYPNLIYVDKFLFKK